VLAGGLFRALREIKEGEDIFIVYAKDYNWNCIKRPAYADLLSELARVIPRMWKFLPKNWAEAKAGRDHISRWLAKIIKGDMDGSISSLHSSSGSETLSPPLELVRRITFGPFVRKYTFKVWGKENEVNWEDKPYAKRARGRFTRSWNGDSTMNISFPEVLSDNGAIREFAGHVGLMRAPAYGTKILEDPMVAVDVGDLRVSIRIGGARLQQNLEKLKSIKSLEQLGSFLLPGKFWRVSYRNNPVDDSYPGKGWCGYLAIDQIRRKADHPSNLDTSEGIRDIVETLAELVRIGHGPIRKNWRNVPEKGRTPKEIVSSVIDALSQSRSFLTNPYLEFSKWLPTAFMRGLNSRYE
jgi:hypothetical protein